MPSNRAGYDMTRAGVVYEVYSRVWCGAEEQKKGLCRRRNWDERFPVMRCERRFPVRRDRRHTARPQRQLSICSSGEQRFAGFESGHNRRLVARFKAKDASGRRRCRPRMPGTIFLIRLPGREAELNGGDALSALAVCELRRREKRWGGSIAVMGEQWKEKMIRHHVEEAPTGLVKAAEVGVLDQGKVSAAG